MAAAYTEQREELVLEGMDSDALRRELLRMELKRREMKARRRHTRPGSMPVARLRREFLPEYPGSAVEELPATHLFQNA